MRPIRIKIAVFVDANLPRMILEVGGKKVNAENIGEYIKSTSKDSEVLRFLKQYAGKKKVHVIFLTRDKRFCEDSGYKPHSLVTVIVLQNYHEVIPEVIGIGNLESSDLKETIKLVFNYIVGNLRPFAI